MSQGGQRKRKSKGWYLKQAALNKRAKTDEKRGHRLTAGLKGFIVTCNDRERDAVRETYNILNEYADKLYGPETKGDAESSGESDGEDIETAIAKEIQDLKDASVKGERRFQNSQTGAKNCIFIKTTLDDPVGLAHAIFTDLRQSKVQKSRYALRLLPVVGTCKAGVKDINELAKEVLKPFFTESKLEVTFGITFKARNNGGIGREMIISTLRETIMEMFPSVLLRFTHTNPQITILVEVMCKVACIAVAKDFALFRKYNLVEVVQDKSAEPTGSGDGVQPENAPVKPNPIAEVVDEAESQKDEANEPSCEKQDSEESEPMLGTTEETATVPVPQISSGKEGVNGSVSSTSEPHAAKTERAQGESTDDSVPDADVSSGEKPSSNPPATLEQEMEDAGSIVSVVSDCARPVVEHSKATGTGGCDETSDCSVQTGDGPQDLESQPETSSVTEH